MFITANIYTLLGLLGLFLNMSTFLRVHALQPHPCMAIVQGACGSTMNNQVSSWVSVAPSVPHCGRPWLMHYPARVFMWFAYVHDVITSLHRSYAEAYAYHSPWDPAERPLGAGRSVTGDPCTVKSMHPAEDWGRTIRRMHQRIRVAPCLTDSSAYGLVGRFAQIWTPFSAAQ